ncbi:glutaredoxin [Puccinia graminis f. sp. tritici]|uniref:Glutaredoxin n=1 Tax=Puccinia graminis f. sp. tritici TaxID=56615 RepID=A0A5B0N9E9_PUCGR|nr:glutaredoxin [Puccinia graminis f. sp. tritici]KAA1084728.1 glutaredoxin [Puccinia graminis f. sp. tritici]
MATLFRMMRSFTNCSLLKMSTNANNLSVNELNEIQKSIDTLISSNKVLIFSKSYCPYCDRSKSFLNDKLKSKQIKIKSLELDIAPNGSIIQTLLSKRLNKEKITVPQIFINSQHIGGCDDLLTKEQKGELDQLL